MYFITVFEKPTKGYGRPVLGNKRCWGYYYDLGAADDAVRHNITDLRENIYDYAVIEKINPGIVGDAMVQQWYKFNKRSKKYLMINTPVWAKNICNFAIG